MVYWKERGKKFINCKVLCKFKNCPSWIWNSAYWFIQRTRFSGSSCQAGWRKLCEETHNHPPLSWDIGLMWLGCKGGLSLRQPRRQKLWLCRKGRERERGDSSMRTPFIIRAISLLIKWPCVNSSTSHSSRVIKRGTLADRSWPHGLLNQGELLPPEELYLTQPSPRITERLGGGGRRFSLHLSFVGRAADLMLGNGGPGMSSPPRDLQACCI